MLSYLVVLLACTVALYGGATTTTTTQEDRIDHQRIFSRNASMHSARALFNGGSFATQNLSRIESYRNGRIAPPSIVVGDYPIVSQSSDIFQELGRYGGTTQESWSIIPYACDPTIGGTGRCFTVTIYAPAAVSSVPSGATLFNMRFIPGFLWQMVDVPVGYDSIPLADGQFPLYVYSPGLVGDSAIYGSDGYKEATFGKIVVIIDFSPGDADVSDSNGASTVQLINNRVTDIKHIIDRMINRSNTVGDLFYQHIDTDKIYVGGHSYGGASAFIAGVGIKNFLLSNQTIVKDDRIVAMNLHDASDQLMTFEQLSHNRLPTLVSVSANQGGVDGMRSFYAGRSGFLNLKLRVNNSMHMNFAPDLCPLLFLLGIEDPAQLYAMGFGHCVPAAGVVVPFATFNLINQGYTAVFFELLNGNVNYLPYVLPNCVEYIRGNLFELWTQNNGDEWWSPPSSAIANLYDPFGQGLVAYYEWAYANGIVLSDGRFRYLQHPRPVAARNCNIPLLSV